MNAVLEERAQAVRMDRRKNLDLRERFEAAQNLLRPILGDVEVHNGAAFYRAMTKLQSAYPDLSGSEIEALVAAVVRTFSQRTAYR